LVTFHGFSCYFELKLLYLILINYYYYNTLSFKEILSSKLLTINEFLDDVTTVTSISLVKSSNKEDDI
jgi:hypothetical protein